jgi:hypothetical protein
MRLFAVLTAALALLVVGAAPVSAGNHNGPQSLAKGSGDVTTTSSQQTGGQFANVCLTSDLFCQFFLTGFQQISSTIQTTTVKESFDFSAKLGPNASPTDPTSGATGNMKLSYESSTTTAVVLTPIGSTACNNPAYIVAGGCPTPSSTTSPTQTATATADVTCLNVIQNRASIGGHVIKFSGNFTPTRGMLFNGTDNTIARQQTTPDQFAGSFVSDVPYTCPPPSADAPITSGDVYVQQS